MRTFEVFRNGCNSQQKLLENMNDLWYDPAFEIVYPENLYNSPSEAYNAFMAFQNIYGNIGVAFHLYRLRFDITDTEDYAISVSYSISEGLLAGYQSILALSHYPGEGPCIIMLVNPVSNTGAKLYDNNAASMAIVESLRRITGNAWKPGIGYTMFDGSNELNSKYSDLKEDDRQ